MSVWFWIITRQRKGKTTHLCDCSVCWGFAWLLTSLLSFKSLAVLIKKWFTMDFAAICTTSADCTIQIPFSIGKSLGHFSSAVKLNTHRKGLDVTHDIIKVMTMVFVMEDIKAVRGSVSEHFVHECNYSEQRPANNGGIGFPQGGLTPIQTFPRSNMCQAKWKNRTAIKAFMILVVLRGFFCLR